MSSSPRMFCQSWSFCEKDLDCWEGCLLAGGDQRGIKVVFVMCVLKLIFAVFTTVLRRFCDWFGSILMMNRWNIFAYPILNNLTSDRGISVSQRNTKTIDWVQHSVNHFVNLTFATYPLLAAIVTDPGAKNIILNEKFIVLNAKLINFNA